MELKKLDRAVLKLWYIHAAIKALIWCGVITGAIIIPQVVGATDKVTIAISLGVVIPAILIIALVLILPYFRYKMYAWGYDDKRIIIKCGVIFRHRVVIPVCQIQDLHRTQGPIMMMLNLSGVIISTAGSNFGISTLTTDEADRMIDDLEHKVEVRVEELRNEEI